MKVELEWVSYRDQIIIHVGIPNGESGHSMFERYKNFGCL